MNYINDILNKKCISKQITVNTDFLLDKELDLKSKGLLITLICLLYSNPGFPVRRKES